MSCEACCALRAGGGAVQTEIVQISCRYSPLITFTTPKEGEILFVQLEPEQIIPTNAENKNIAGVTSPETRSRGLQRGLTSSPSLLGSALE